MFSTTKMLLRLQLPPPSPILLLPPPSITPKPPNQLSFENDENSLSSNLLSFDNDDDEPFYTEPPKPITDTGLLFREKLIYLQELNVDPHKALHLNPSLRSAPLSSLLHVEDLLSSVGLSRPSIGRILDMHPQLLTSNPKSHILPVIRFLLDEIGVPFFDLPRSLYRCPRLLVSCVSTQLRPALAFLESLGFTGPNAVDSRTTVLLVSNVENTLIPKMEYLQSLGFKRREVAKMVLRSPGLLTFSLTNNLVPKVEYFREEMGGEVKELKKFPQYFSFSLEKKIKPRHKLLLEYGLSMTLSQMLKVSDGEFDARLIEMRLRPTRGRCL